MSEEKPDGYVPWHDSVGAMIDHAGSTEDQCWLGWLGPNWQERLYKAARPEIPVEEGGKMGDPTQYRGWRIRPVKLVFLDEEEST